MGISPEQFEKLQTRLSRASSSTKSAHPLPTQPTLSNGDVVIGIDPSLRGTGFGLIQVNRPNHKALEFGRIACPSSWRKSQCLSKIAGSLETLLSKTRPKVCAIEGLFYAQNLQTALIMGEARGAILCVLARNGIPVYELAPRKMKQAIVGFGAAQKHAVSKMVQRMLQLQELPEPDEADALALALTFIQEINPFSLSKIRLL